MKDRFDKFPTTPHLLWLGNGALRGDKIFSPNDADLFLRQLVTVEEKVDGANLGISFDLDGNLVAQNRGTRLLRGKKDQFSLIWAWLASIESDLFDVLEDRFILFGEWCYARHSIHYTRLPSYFLAFDIFDKQYLKFLNVCRRNEMFLKLNLTVVPRVTEGLFSLQMVPKLIGQSFFYDGPMEGIYLRQDGPVWLTQRAKVVRAEFAQMIDEHWTQLPPVANLIH
ncbi:MAG: RNA ligase family protein, partial [Planctomycetota bacterium]